MKGPWETEPDWRAQTETNESSAGTNRREKNNEQCKILASEDPFMKKQSRTILLALLVVGLGMALWSDRLHEPFYRGKPLSYWIDPSANGGHETVEERNSALAEMSDRAVPYLIKQLRWEPGLIEGLYYRFPGSSLLTAYVRAHPEPRSRAAHSLGEFGPLASNAIPELTRVTKDFTLDSAEDDCANAAAALIKIKQEALSPYIQRLNDTSARTSAQTLNWCDYALVLGALGTNAAAAVPSLLRALGPTNDSEIRGHAIIALGKIHSIPEASIPALLPFLTSSDVGQKERAVSALGGFGSAAKSAWAPS